MSISARNALIVLSRLIPSFNPLNTLKAIKPVAASTTPICKTMPSSMPVSLLIADETTEVPKPRPVAQVPMVPTMNNKSMSRPGHNSCCLPKTSAQAELSLSAGIWNT